MSFITIAQNAQTELVIEKSRFICTLQKVQSEAEAQDFIREQKKHYWDATHNCSAYVVTDLLQRSSDDGEPGGTAGVPMLEVLRKARVQGVAAVVTRYFGGIKLGAGGLVRAYTNAVSTALQAAGRAERVELGRFLLTLPAVQAGKTVNLLYADGTYPVEEVRYGAEEAVLSFLMRREQQCAAEQYLTELLKVPVTLEYISSEFREIRI